MFSCSFLLQWRTVTSLCHSQTWPSPSPTARCMEQRLRCPVMKGEQRMSGFRYLHAITLLCCWTLDVEFCGWKYEFLKCQKSPKNNNNYSKNRHGNSQQTPGEIVKMTIKSRWTVSRDEKKWKMKKKSHITTVKLYFLSLNSYKLIGSRIRKCEAKGWSESPKCEGKRFLHRNFLKLHMKAVNSLFVVCLHHQNQLRKKNVLKM